MSPWGVASGGCKPEVKKLPLKSTGEARCKPPRGRAWLKDRMVSENEAGFNLRETFPLPRNTLHSLEVMAQADTGQRSHPMSSMHLKDDRGWTGHGASPKDVRGHLKYPLTDRDTAKSGMGWATNRHLHDLAESVTMNVGGWLAEVSSPPMKQASVGGPIVVRGRESRPHGKGGQLVRISTQNNRMLTGMKFP
jgi:hypothetical protein